MPRNMQAFWRFLLQKSLQKDSLVNLQVATFGLGDSSYEKFNAAARKLTARLKQLGASLSVPCGMGDDQGLCDQNKNDISILFV